jgi:hypothetical protein
VLLDSSWCFYAFFIDRFVSNSAVAIPVFVGNVAPGVIQMNSNCTVANLHTLSHRVARFLERQGVLVERDAENSYLQLDHSS